MVNVFFTLHRFLCFHINFFLFLDFSIIFTVLTLVTKWYQNPKTQNFVLKNQQCVIDLRLVSRFCFEMMLAKLPSCHAAMLPSCQAAKLLSITIFCHVQGFNFFEIIRKCRKLLIKIQNINVKIYCHQTFDVNHWQFNHPKK